MYIDEGETVVISVRKIRVEIAPIEPLPIPPAYPQCNKSGKYGRNMVIVVSGYSLPLPFFISTPASTYNDLPYISNT